MYAQIFQLHADLHKALAHPKRLEIVHLLRDQELPVSDIHTMLDLPQANISQHLMVLREAHVVVSRRDGKQIFYKLSDPNISTASDALRNVLIAQHKGTELADEFSLKMQELVPVVQDPVCHMRVSPKTAGFHLSYNHQDYYFCASGCLSKFTHSPTKYV